MHEDALANGPITNWLAIVGVVSLIYWAWRLGAALLSRGRGTRDPGKASSPAVVARDEGAAAPTPENDIAVIAAAVYATLGAHRIVHLEAAGRDQNWAVEGRWMQQTSHRTRA